MPYVYILFSESLQKFYIGSTGDLPEGRLEKHLKSNKGFTAQVKDWKIVYTEIFADISSARKREYQLKSWKSAKRIAELIQRSSIE